jgi:hypothetical protein
MMDFVYAVKVVELYGLRFTVYGLRFTVYGLRFTVYGLLGLCTNDSGWALVN